MDIPPDIDLSDSKLGERRRAIGLDDDDRARLRARLPAMQHHWPAFLERLYARLAAHPETAALLSRPGTIERLTRAQTRYLATLFGAPLDRAQADLLVRLGLVHFRLGVTPQWYVATYAHFICEHLAPLAAATDPDPADVAALVRSVFYDIGLVLDAYGVGEALARRNRRAEFIAPPDHAAGTAPATQSATAAASATAAPILQVQLTGDSVADRCRYLGIDAASIATLNAMAGAIAAQTPRVLDDFYDFFTRHPETAGLVPPQVVTRLRRQVASYWQELAASSCSRPYAASRMRIGLMHERIGLSLQWYFGGIARQLVSLLSADGIRGDSERQQALVRAVFFDLTFIVDAYLEARAEALARAEGYATELVASLGTAVAVLDAGGRVISANRALLELYPGDPGLLYRMRAEDALPAAEVRAVLERLAREPAQRAVTLGRLSGRPVKYTAYRLTQRADLPQGATALLVDDVSDVYRAAIDATTGRARLVDLLDSSTAVLWEMDPASGTLLAASAGTLALTGYRDIWFVGRPDGWASCVALRDRERLAGFLRELAPGQRRAIDYRIVHAEGAERWVRSHVSLQRDAADAAPTLRAVTLAIGAERREQQQRLQSVGVLAGGVAHMLNNSLMAIGGSLEMLGQTLREPGRGAATATATAGSDPAALIDAALAEIAVARGTTAKMLAFAGQQVLRPALHSLDELVRDVLGAEAAEEGGAPLRLELDSPTWPALVDADKFAAALGCLVANAREATPAGGAVVVQVRNRAGAAIEPTDVGVGSDWIEVAVIDSGIGMSPTARRRATEPFFSTKAQEDGHYGLGLSMALGFAVQSGGYLAIDSAEGVGTSVRLRLPRQLPQGAAALEAPQRTPTALLVEDHALVRRVIAALLRGFGFAVTETASAAEALEAATRESFELLLSDVRLGRGMDGVELAGRIEQRLPGVAIVLMSGYTAEHLDLGRLPPHFRFIEKPFAPEALRREIDLARRSAAPVARDAASSAPGSVPG